MLGKQLQTAAAGSGAAAGLGIEDVFSTWLFEGDGGYNLTPAGNSVTVTNGIDLAGEGGLVWWKTRSKAQVHWLADTERGTQKTLMSQSANGQNTQSTATGGLTSFNSDGFTLGADLSGYATNERGEDYASWTFRKAPGFFDVVTYTGNGVAGRTVAHNLGSVPGFIIIKSTSQSTGWYCYHRSLGVDKYLVLNATEAATNFTLLNSIAPTSADFTLSGSGWNVNENGATYVAYLFAHDEAIFGENADQSVIKCGSYTGNGSSQEIDLGWEPQWVLIKPTSYTGNWYIYDSMRGMANNGNNQPSLNPNLSNAEGLNYRVHVTSRGFAFNAEGAPVNSSGGTHIYIAIRRGPMKTPTDATTVFSVLDQAGTGAATTVTTGLVTDMFFRKCTTTAFTGFILDRLRDNAGLIPSATDAESTGITAFASGLFANNTGFAIATGGSSVNGIGNDFSTYAFRRAPGFFDVVAYDATGVVQTLSHNLGVTPECIIVKGRNSTYDWGVYHTGLLDSTNYAVRLNTDGAEFSSTIFNKQNPTSTNFYVNYTSGPYIAYLFATCPGVSKVGSYTGTGSNINVDCGFSAGARFVLIKRTDSTGDWYVWDTARGIVSGNDPYVVLNTNVAEVTTTDYIDPYTSGFTVTSTAPAALNASGGNYIFLAIA